MTSEQVDHLALYTLLESKLGEQEAAALVSSLLTKDYLSSRFDAVDTRLDGLGARLDGVDTRLDGMATKVELADLRAETRVGFARLEAKMARDNRAQLIWLVATIIAVTSIATALAN